jgi:hypothetical protein
MKRRSSMELLACPHLTCEVELGEERRRHIAERHPELLPGERVRVAETLADPDEVRRSARASNARLFSRWFRDLRGGKHVVVVVVLETPPRRPWVLTAYVARRLAQGDVEWKRS